ncbi:hypothetical protein DFJ74DRAFT_705703 [Hyaloraphidium curvatum]|nr:hypothetical protein DFJ74DRAFT_705703 [Hyaloraphidium curvatum]
MPSPAREITRPEALALARAWCKACSTNDAAGALAHFAEDVLFRTPRARMAWEKSGGKIGSPTGILHGLAEVGPYLTAGLATPGVRLDLVDACLPAAPNRVACAYKRESGTMVCEVFDVEWREGEWKVVAVENFYGDGPQ